MISLKSHNGIFNEIPVDQTCSENHLGIMSDDKLIFEEHLYKVISKANNTVCLICKLQNVLTRSALLTIFLPYNLLSVSI